MDEIRGCTDGWRQVDGGRWRGAGVDKDGELLFDGVLSGVGWMA